MRNPGFVLPSGWRAGFLPWRALVATVFAVLSVYGVAHAEPDQILYSFNAGLGPASPGKLYFSTLNYSNGSVEYPGAVVQANLNPGHTQATVTTLHVFTGASGEGAYPSALLLRDGALYGTTLEGGDLSCPLQNGCGTVFKLTASTRCPPTNWCETVLYRFEGKRDGMEPSGGVIADRDGNLYGTTQAGGTACQDGCGTIFELKVTKQNSTGYEEHILYRFPPRPGTYVGRYGSAPSGPLHLAADGALYGTAESGGANGFGTIFELRDREPFVGESGERLRRDAIRWKTVCGKYHLR